MSSGHLETERATRHALREYAELFDHLQADELHDTVCQTLAGTSFFVKVLLGRAQAGKPIEAADIQKVAGFLDQAMGDLRAIIAPPDSMTGSGLSVALDRFARSISQNVPCRISSLTEAVADPQSSVVLYRLARWAIRRLVPSSESIAISLSQSDDRLVIEVSGESAHGFGDVSDSEKEFLCHYATTAGKGIDCNVGAGTLRCSAPILEANA